MKDNDTLILTDKKKFNIAVPIAAVAVVGAAGVAAFTFVPSLNNIAKMTFSSPEEYYSDVLTSSRDKLTEAVKAGIKLSGTEEVKAFKGKASVTLSKELMEDTADIAKEMTLDLNYMTASDPEADSEFFESSFLLNDNPLFSINGLAKNSAGYLQIPELSDTWLYVSEEKLKEEYGVEENPINARNVLTAERAEVLIGRYSDIYLKYADEVTLNKKTEVTSNHGITSTYTEAVIELSAADTEAMAKEYIDTFKSDPDIKAMFIEAGVPEEDYNEMIAEDVDLSDVTFSDVNIYTYIDKYGSIAGFKVTENNDGKEYEYSQIFYTDGKSADFEMICKSDENGFSADLLGTAEDSVFSGSGKLTFTDGDQEYSVDISASDIRISADPAENFSGSISLGTEIEDVGIEMNITGNEGAAVTEIKFSQEDWGWFKVSVSSEETEFVPVEEPSSYKDITDNKELADYLNNADFSKIKENVKGLSGVLGSDVCDELVSLIEELEATDFSELAEQADQEYMF